MRNRMRLAIPAITLLLTLPLARADAEKPAASGGYRNNGNGTVTDLKTNLIWQRCSVGQNNDAKCSGSAQAMNWDAAVKTCENLRLAGKTWRLPEKDELGGLVDTSQSPAINAGSFPGTVDSYYWSGSTYAPNTAYAWDVYFTVGDVGYSSKPAILYVRCVSGIKRISIADEPKPDEPARTAVADLKGGAEKPATDGFRDNGDGTVTDLKTNLIWQRCSVGQNNDAACSGGAQKMNWNTAIRTCKDLKLAGKTWRLSEKDELKSLVRCSDGTPAPLKDDGDPYRCGWSGGKSYDNKYQEPTIAGAFPGTVAFFYWSGSTSAPATYAWGVFFADGAVVSANKPGGAYVRCVTAGL